MGGMSTASCMSGIECIRLLLPESERPSSMSLSPSWSKSLERWVSGSEADSTAAEDAESKSVVGGVSSG